MRLLITCALAAVVVLVVPFACSCQPVPKSDNLGATTDVQTLVNRAVRNWVLPRLAVTHDTTNNTAIFLDRAYKLTQSLQQLIDWFRLVLVPDPDRQDLWDMRELIAQIKGAEIYQTGAVDDAGLHLLIIQALDAVIVEPDDAEDNDQD